MGHTCWLVKNGPRDMGLVAQVLPPQSLDLKQLCHLESQHLQLLEGPIEVPAVTHGHGD